MTTSWRSSKHRGSTSRGGPWPSIERSSTFHRRGSGGNFERGLLGVGGNDLDGDLRRQQGFEVALEAAFDEQVDRAAAAGAYEDLLAAVDGRVFGQELG